MLQQATLTTFGPPDRGVIEADTGHSRPVRRRPIRSQPTQAGHSVVHGASTLHTSRVAGRSGGSAASQREDTAGTMTTMRRHSRNLGLVLFATVLTSTVMVVADPRPVEAALVVVADYRLDETTTGTDRVMVDAGPFDLDGSIGDSISTTAFDAATRGYRWSYTAPDTGPKDPERLAVVETNENLNPGGADFAVEIRYRTTYRGGNIVQKGQSSTDGGYWKLEQNDGFPTCVFRRNGSDSASVVGPVRTSDGAWHTVRCERRANSVRMYVDGQEVDRRNRSIGPIANSFEMTIGGKSSCNQASVGCDYFTGDVDWVRIEKDVPAIPNDPPTMRIATPVCAALTCTFDSTASSDPDGEIVDRVWDFGDGGDVDDHGEVVQRSFASAGTYVVSLVGTDDDGALSTPATVEVTVTGPPNQPPAMAFTVTCAGRVCTFDSSASTDGDGSIVSRRWDFGDGTSTTRNDSLVQHAFAGDGIYTVRLTGTDNGGAVDATAQSVEIDPVAPTGSLLVPLPPQRVFDTRPGEPGGGPTGVVRGGTSIDVTVTGVAGVPATGVTAVALNVTAIGIEAPGFVSARPAGTPESTTSSLNLVNAGDVRANLIVVPVGHDGAISLTSLRDAHLIGDIAGYFTGDVATSDAGRIVTQSPRRLFDTRPSDDPGPKGKLPAGGSITVPVLGRSGVPSAGVAAVVLNVTTTETEGPGFVTVWPSGTERPLASTLNVNRSGDTVANQIIVPVGADGAIRLFALSSSHLLADVTGYVTDDDAPVTSTGLFVGLPPVRAFDTREGEPAAGPKGIVPAGGTIRTRLVGVAGVPESAGGVVLNLTLVGTAPGFATIWPAGATRPGTSSVNVDTGGDVRPNGAIVRIGDDGSVDAFLSAAGHLLADVSGYLLA